MYDYITVLELWHEYTYIFSSADNFLYCYGVTISISNAKSYCVLGMLISNNLLSQRIPMIGQAPEYTDNFQFMYDYL